jgi:hypothetical protein
MLLTPCAVLVGPGACGCVFACAACVCGGGGGGGGGDGYTVFRLQAMHPCARMICLQLLQ